MNHVELDLELAEFGTRECQIFRNDIFEFHRNISGYLKSHAVYVYKSAEKIKKGSGNQAANLALLGINTRLIFGGSTLALTQTEVDELGSKWADNCGRTIARTYACTKSYRQSAIAVREYAESKGITFPFPKNWIDKPKQKLMPFIKRIKCEKWWQKQVRKKVNRQLEGVLRELGFVWKDAASYISNFSLARHKQRKSRNRRILEDIIAISNFGDVMTLAEISDSTISNPKNRRNEFMTRARGCEEVAIESGCSALFLTMTCPSPYHATLQKTGIQNPKFNGATPKDAMDYLNRTWQQIRADLNKKGIQLFGFRICEPHHDGTPHFHILIYLRPEHVKQTSDIFIKHNMKAFSDEKGAKKYRCDVKQLDFKDGSPTGYIAKYIAKNIDGHEVGTDNESGLEAATAAERVAAWASVWGIRQFQPIGNVPISVWREFRRIPQHILDAFPDEAKQAQKAADEGNFADFIKANGGPFVERAALPFRALHVITEKVSMYGEDIKKIFGIVTSGGQAIQTRFKTWTTKPAWLVESIEGAQPPTLEYCK